MMKPAVFLDKDGTLLTDMPYNVDPGRMAWAPGAREGVELLGRLGHPLIVISNQPGVALGHFDEDALGAVRRRLAVMFRVQGARLAGFYYCPHHPQGKNPAYALSCVCRKPMPGLLRLAAADHGIDLRASWFVGDILNDVEAGARAGCHTVLLDNGHETEWVRGRWRTPDDVAPDLFMAARLIAQKLRTAPARGKETA
ncbi:D-glycero-alpha-D-manno-heptose-1,7-bisphosphate 7-phosphatase [Bordetella bronchialis]|uniref:D,D-heptose 1,7-bisphosphate phosphatase n=1 Tax=Bordetella bronchialis TaxID=463025 RepID=A0A193G2Y0_9BORD|nr:HAD-IIIA family hydrolase [Bordetella bronchialis]ANN68443.1 HAD family hydrolase [Bordetella bronchialis]ANN73584.1 HAD family hydrolase [Bordetella bronchialis]